MLRASQTKAEQRLWYHLRDSRFLGLKFRRQRQIGPYIADFVCLEWKLVIEADGGQHGSEADLRRDAWFERNGYTVLRFWNNDVLAQTTSVLEYLREVVIRLGHVEAPALTPGPSPASGRGEQTGALHMPSRVPASGAAESPESVRSTGMQQAVGVPQTLELATDIDSTDLPSPASGRGAGGEGGSPQQRQATEVDNAHPAHGAKPQP